MGQGEVFVNRVARLQGTLIAETDLSSGILRTPCFVPKITSGPEFDLLLNQNHLRSSPELACYEITSVRRLTDARARSADQRTITGASADPVYDNFRNSTITMTDPLTECFSFKKTYSKSEDDTVYVRDRIAQLRLFPQGVLEILTQSNPPWDEKFWQELVEKDLHLALIDWYVRHQKTANPGIFLPPTNVVRGNRSLETSLKLNEATGAAFPPGEDRLIPAFYLILHATVFRSKIFMETLRSHISAVLPRFKVLVLKPLYIDSVVNSAPRRDELVKLLNQIDELKRQSEDSFLAIAVDVGEAGLALLAHGFDAYVEPLSGFIWFPQAGGKTKEQRAREEEDLDLVPREEYWLHPTYRKELPMTAEEAGALCDCSVHVGIHDSTPKERTTLRKAHHYNLRTQEIDLLVEAVGQADDRFFTRVLGKGTNKNLTALLPLSGKEAELGVKR